MIVADVGDNGEQGRDDIGAIQPATEACFDNGNVYTCFGKCLEGHHYGDLEKGWFYLFYQCLVLAHKGHYPFLAYWCAVYAYALAKVDKVR